ncbi:MAG: putative baseplate assembly protein [Myxococcales bacterium]|nr:putative baseplate assembly protein [Myxococcales bacterium]MCB9580293.1 putative baseplate assembly protein [Polyangiaceae bacterium]
MPLAIPNLDQRRFEQIVTEIRRRVPTFTPEWTDLNESDPGITLAQLFAFMTEQLLFQVNQVPEKGLITFLKMVGAELHPKTPATADITFTVADATAPKLVEVLAGTQVQTQTPPPGEKTPITFETARRFFALNGELGAIGSIDCNGDFVAHTAANESLIASFAPFGSAGTVKDCLFLGFDLNAAGPWPEGTIRLRVNLAGSKEVGEPGTEELGPCSAELTPPKRIEWSFAVGHSTTPDGRKNIVFSNPITLALDSTQELRRSGYLEIALDKEQAQSFTVADSDVEIEFLRDLFVIRARVIDPDEFSEPPKIDTVRLNSVDALAVTSITAEALGGSTGLPFQRFVLANAPVRPMSLELVVNETTEGGGASEEWQEVDDLFAAGADDRVFQVLYATGEVLFGDGHYGKIPPPDDGSAPEGNIKALRYQFGGGVTGNVGAETLTTVLSGTPPLPSMDATNVLPARGGADEEPLALGLARAPAVVRSRYRAVTARDFEALAMETPSARVARAHTLPNTRPGRDPGRSPGTVTVVLVPQVPFEESIFAPIGLPSVVARAVLAYLDARRLVTTPVFVDAAKFRRIRVDVTLVVDPRVSLTATRAGAMDSLHRFFHALVGGEDGFGWPFGGAVFHSRVSQRLFQVEGVLRVDGLELSLDDGPFVACQDLEICDGELLYSGEHTVRVRPA